MNIPVPKAGLVIRYSFLWSHEAQSGVTEGRKDRPAAIVVATQNDKSGDVRVIVAAITHEPPLDPNASIELPSTVIRTLGLDGERQWIRLDELNRFSWPGFDLRPVPGKPGVYDYGMLPQQLYAKMKAGILALQAAKAITSIPRD